MGWGGRLESLGEKGDEPFQHVVEVSYLADAIRHGLRSVALAERSKHGVDREV